MGHVNYAELGAFLRSRRERIRPGDVGLVSGPRRRVPGLRRDEVAQLAGASVDYYNELERGAGSQPSEQMIAALARALRLTADERDHLYHLADRPVPVHGGASSHVHPGMLDLLHRLASTPAQVITDLHVTLVQNPLAVALVGTSPVSGEHGPASSTGGSPSPTPGGCTRRRTTRPSPVPSSPICARPPPGGTRGTPRRAR